MKLAALYDIHGNLPALEAVLKEIERLEVEELVIGGDVILGPMSNECLDRLLSIQIPTHFLLGNCETSVLDELGAKPLQGLPENVAKNIRWTAHKLSPSHREIIAQWPKALSLAIDGLGEVFFCHATPRSETENFTRLSPKDRLEEIFASVAVPIVVCGHTHMQFDLKVGETRVLNAGSVGMPFGNPGAYWLLCDEGFEFRFTAYDQIKASQMIQKSSYPGAEEFAINYVLNPPTEEFMLKVFEK